MAIVHRYSAAPAPSHIKDSDLRGIVLQKFYDRRREDREISLHANDFKHIQADFEWPDIFRACDQLAEHGLIHWEGLRGRRGQSVHGVGRITAFGADVIEGTATSTIAVNVDNRSYAFDRSSHNVIGDKNVQIGDVTIGQIAHTIATSAVAEDQKEKAKNLLAETFENPILRSVLGTLAESAIRTLDSPT